jgi:hypothetical protein
MREHHVGSTIVSPRDRSESVTRRSGDPHSRRIRRVCAECNNGWMSQLQQAAKPYLVPMLTGERVELRKNAQTLIAAWSAMMAMVAEFMDPEMVAVPSDDRLFLRYNRHPPRHWRIWIAQHRRESHPLYTHNVLPFGTEEEVERLPRDTTADPNAQTSTICVGKQLLVHVMNSRIARDLIRRWRLPRDIAPVVLQIWPIKGQVVTWPPPAALTDSGIDLLAQQFFSAASTLARRWAES